jgi:hypothetical protein
VNFKWPKCEIPTSNEREAGCTGECDIFAVVPLETRETVEAECNVLLERVGNEIASILFAHPTYRDTQIAADLRLQLPVVEKARPFADRILAMAQK